MSAPKNCSAVWDGIQKMRPSSEAVVDTMGRDQENDVNLTADLKAYHTLVNLMLSV